MTSIFNQLFRKKKPVEQVVEENNQKVHDIKNQMTRDILQIDYEVRQLHKTIRQSTAYKVAMATGRI